MVQLTIQHLFLAHQLLYYRLSLVYLISHHLLNVLVLLPQNSQRKVLVLYLTISLKFLLLQTVKFPS